MGRNNYFQFKQFKIIQERAAMKVGTDGVLLGAWVQVDNENTILDVGTGTGLIALMLAQKTKAKIFGVEIEINAALEAKENIFKSPWGTRIEIINDSFQNYIKSAEHKFDLIISNPPFFIQDKKPVNTNVAVAKHSDLLPLKDLIEGSIYLLNKPGKLALILPVLQAQKAINMAEINGLFLTRITEVKPTPSKEPNRLLIEFSSVNKVLDSASLTIYDNLTTNYSSQYKELTQDFYLNF